MSPSAGSAYIVLYRVARDMQRVKRRHSCPSSMSDFWHCISRKDLLFTVRDVVIIV
jgi:hypothetical protein